MAIGLLDGAANLLFALATGEGLLSVVGVLGSLYPVVTAVLAWAVVKERLRPIQVLGSAMAVAGAVVIAV